MGRISPAVLVLVVAACAESRPPPPPPDIGLHEAALAGNLEAVRQHIEAGTDLNARDAYGSTPLFIAITFDRTDAARALIDGDGDLWVAEHRLFTSPGSPRWAVFDPEGGLVTVVAAPAGLRVLAITHDRLIGRSSDDLGVEHVVAYAIER